MKFGQLIEYNKRNVFLQKSCKKWGSEASSTLFFFFFLKKNFKWGKSKSSSAWIQHISIAFNLAYNKNKLYKTLDYWSRDILNFHFLKKDLGIVFSIHFVYDFSRKMFLMLYSIDWTNFIVLLPLLLEILGNMCIAIVCFPVCDIIHFEINLIFLIKPFFNMGKSSRQKFKNLANEKSF